MNYILLKELMKQSETACGFDSNRFAQLIMMECYEECKRQMLPKGMAEEHGLNYNDGVMDCAIGLLQHFGVE
jgi:hypothetical protein